MHQIRQKKPKPSKRNATSSLIAPTSGVRPTSVLVNRAVRSTIARRGAIIGVTARSGLSLLSLIWALSSLSLSLSFSGSYLKWKWGERLIFGSKVKILVNRKSFSGKWYFPWQPNMQKRVKMIFWNHFHPKQTHPKVYIAGQDFLSGKKISRKGHIMRAWKHCYEFN